MIWAECARVGSAAAARRVLGSYRRGSREGTKSHRDWDEPPKKVESTIMLFISSNNTRKLVVAVWRVTCVFVADMALNSGAPARNRCRIPPLTRGEDLPDVLERAL